MSELLTTLTNAVRAQGNTVEAALLLSGGLDSVSVGLALQSAERAIHAYTFHLDNTPSKDLKRAIRIAAHFGWRHTGIEIPTAHLAKDFLRLAFEHRCPSKVHFEVLYPMLYVLPAIQESEVYTGWNADFYCGNGKEDVMRQRRLIEQGLSSDQRKAKFDEERLDYIEKLRRPSNETWSFAQRMAATFGKKLLSPYLDQKVCDFFLRFDQEQLSPASKPIVRQALGPELAGLPKNTIGRRAPLQKGSGVSALFATLLDNPSINGFEKPYTSVSQLLQRWGREVSKRDIVLEEKSDSEQASHVNHRTYPRPSFQPYSMADVHKAADGSSLRAVSLFAGGGGSCIGLHLAGFSVVAANEFVAEAARTYRKNFPRTPVDTRNIRDISAHRDNVLSFLSSAGMAVGETDIVCGSPPCSEFSSLGSGITDPSVNKPYSDTTQQAFAALIFDFMRFNRAALPKVVISENVPPLAGAYRPLLEAALDHLRLTKAGGERLYYVAYRVLAADDYGVPQARKRLLIIAVRSDVADAVGMKGDADVLRLFPPPTSAPVSIRHAFRSLHQTKEHVRPWREAMWGTALHDIVRQLPRAPEARTRPADIGLGALKWFTLTRPAWDLPCPTLTVMGQKPDGLSGVIHPDEDRKFTIPELKRLTSLPEDFLLSGTLAQGVERICRMVPPLMIKAVADRVRDLVLTPYGEAANG